MPYVIQGKLFVSNTEKVLHDTHTMFSLRELIEALVGSVSFDNDTKVSTAVIRPLVRHREMATRRCNGSPGNGKDVPVNPDRARPNVN